MHTLPFKKLIAAICVLAGAAAATDRDFSSESIALATGLQDQAGSRAAFRVRVRSLSALAGGGASALNEVDRLVTTMSRAGGLRRVKAYPDTLVAGRQHERFEQIVNGVPVWAATVTRQVDSAGLPVSVFGDVYEGLDAVPAVATVSATAARDIAAADAGVSLGEIPAPLYVLVTDGGPRLVYVIRVVAPGFSVTRYFVDALSGAIVQKRTDLKRQSVGTGTGVVGAEKKISTTPFAGTFVTADSLRPPVLDTFNMRGNIGAVLDFLNGLRPLFPSDYASDADNRWTDAAVVDAHVYSGWTYDYLFKRFGRLGLDDRNLPITNLVHPANRSDFFFQYEYIPDFFDNAGYVGDGIMIYGDGFPSGLTVGGQTFDYFSGALDIVAHELTHGVTDYTSRLDYVGESGALNEAFSDIVATSVEFFFQPPGGGLGQADYLIGEDVVRPGGFRSLSDPAAFDQPDHYSRRYTGREDDGGVHINSGIASHAFHLAVEGGVNRTSGVAVTGVGRANREQIERVFYRAFTSMLPASARFSTARSATIQAARDLYGAGSAVERAITDAWTAVGVS